jgi:NAD(P)-dependent dehydrogenase (short-subunit alcohol dehydrogenase family)
MTFDFSKKVALVTGAASGIGRASALAFARNGARVIVADISVSGGEETARLIQAAGGEAAFIQADVSKAPQVEALIQKIIQKYNRIDFAHNNAGVEGAVSPTAECTEDNWDKTININLKGVWLCMKYEILQMLKQGGGAIVNTSSVAGLVGLRGSPAYAASKHGILGLTKTAALEYAKAGLRINAVCPGLVDTPMIDRQTRRDSQIVTKLTAAEPVGRMAAPEEVAQSVLWLCSEAASFVTGHALAVDGGLLAQ